MECFIDGLKINYDEYGEPDAKCVFVLHGWGCMASTYRSVGNTLMTKYRVIIPELPGFGDSDEPCQGWTTADYTAFTIKLIQHFSCSVIDIIGHSFGTRIMIRLANERNLPFVINKMVFINGAGILSNKVDTYLHDFEIFMNEKHGLILSGKDDELDKLRKCADEDYAYLSDVMCECYRYAVSDDLKKYLPNIRIPTLLIWGEDDTATPVQDGKMMNKLIPDSGLVVLENAGHFSFLDQPIIFRRVMESFFEM